MAYYSGSDVLAPAASPCGSEVLTVGQPVSIITLVGSPSVNSKTGRITVVATVNAPGTLSAVGTILRGATLTRADAAAAKAKTCKRGVVKKGRKCVSNARVLYGSTTLATPGPKTYTLTITPTRRVFAALKRGKRLSVSVTTTFQNRAGGTPATKISNVSVKLKRR